MTGEILIGFWKLIAYENRTRDGQIIHPLGEDPIGYLMYTADGYMSVTIMKRKQPATHQEAALEESNAHHVFARLWQAWKRLGTLPKYPALTRFNSYCGKYEVVDNKVIHHVEVSVQPDLTSTAHEHVFEIYNGKLLLRSEKDDTQQLLIWEAA